MKVQAETTSAVDLEAISDDDIERLLGRESDSEEPEAIRRRQTLGAGLMQTRCRPINALVLNNGSIAVKRSFIR